jgi:FkbM family methyltransferase
VFDIGADFGAYTIPAALNGATVYAFEPRQEGARELWENVYLNEVSDRVHIVKAAVYLGEGKIKIGDPDSKFQLGDQERATTVSTSSKFHGEPVPCVSIDSFVKKSGINRLDWIKIDIEGAELDALMGGWESIRKFKPNLIIECHENYDPFIEFHVNHFVNFLDPTYVGRKETDVISDFLGLFGMRSFHYVFSVSLW